MESMIVPKFLHKSGDAQKSGVFSFFLLFSMLLAAVVLSSCGSDEQEQVDSGWMHYVQSYPGGNVSRQGEIKIFFQDNMIDDEMVGSEFQGRLEFEPSIEGKAIWKGKRELVFQASEPLEGETSYVGRLYAKNLGGVPEDLSPFLFNFSVLKQTAEFELIGFAAPNPQDLSEQHLIGKIHTGDIATDEEVEGTLTFKQDNKALPVEWEHSEDQTSHSFVVKAIQRRENRGKVDITFDPAALGIEGKEDTQAMAIPGLGEFLVMMTRVVQKPAQFVEIAFTDPIGAEQNFQGLVELGKRTDLRYEVEGSRLRVYPAQALAGDYTIKVAKGLQNTMGRNLMKSYSSKVVFSRKKPEVRFAGKGVILPAAEKLLIPVEAVSLKAIRVKAMEVFPANMGVFFQENQLDGDDYMERTGRWLWEKRIVLEADSSAPLDFTRYQIDVTELLSENPGTLFRLELSFRVEDSGYPCSEEVEDVETPSYARKDTDSLGNWNYNLSSEQSSWDNWDNGNFSFGGNSGRWHKRNDPCAGEYYEPYYNNKVKVGGNFIASDLGILAKKGSDNTYHVYVSQLSTAQPVRNAEVKLFNFQSQNIGDARTDGDGYAKINASSPAYFAEVQFGDDRGFLKLNPATALTVSHFDVGGQQLVEGMQGTIYGERGVWRPGDSLFLTVAVQDDQGMLPDGHPVSLRLFNPRGQLIHSATNTDGKGGLTMFRLKTSEDAPTGNWHAVAQVGGLQIEKLIRIETVKPNRLKVDLKFNQDTLYTDQGELEGTLSSEWLHGATAGNLNADIKLKLNPQQVSFTRYSDYEFNDPVREWSSATEEWLEGTLNSSGDWKFQKGIQVENPPVGMLRAVFSSRVFEPSGDFSIATQSYPLHPFSRYVGIKTPPGDQARGMLLTDTLHKAQIALLDSRGKPLSGEVRVKFYKVRWKWWWDQSDDNLSNYISSNYRKTLADTVIFARNGKAEFPFEIKYPQWGRYLLRVCDEKYPEGHCTGKTIYLDWPGWAGKAREEGAGGAAVLDVTADKKEYQPGDQAELRFPAPAAGRALVSIENGTEVVDAFWVETQQGMNLTTVNIQANMAPNVYAHITMIQPHQKRENDRPLRLYGVTPLSVVNPESRLAPELKVAEEVKPGSSFEVKVSEENDRAMVYTVAVVDEGLLGLTAFRTPDLHKYFFRKQSLGVRTWDLYDFVAGAYGANLEKLLALGGGSGGLNKDQMNDRRFPPVVKVLGPFRLERGQTAKHKIDLPEYIGAVRVMLVAGGGSEQQGDAFAPAWGFADQEVKVRTPLMVQATLPRVLAPQEEIEIPVTVFAFGKNMKKVNVSIKTTMEPIGHNGTKAISFDSPGDKMILLRYKTPKQPGKVSVEVKASSGGEHSEQTTNLEVRVPNQKITDAGQTSKLLADETLNLKWSQAGIPHTDSAVLEVSSIPDLGIQKRLDYLLRFPHGCLEQTISRAFPQLYLDQLLSLDPQQKKMLTTNINGALEKLVRFQRADGNFSYWPSSENLNEWSDVWAGHFLVEAGRAGYNTQEWMLTKWLNRASSQASSWWNATSQEAVSVQAYRLYVLALAGKADLAAMNRLRSNEAFKKGQVEALSIWQLAAAYGLAGQKQVAGELLSKAGDDFAKAKLDKTFRSALRDRAAVLEAAYLLEDQEKAKELERQIRETLASDAWASTQSTAWALMALTHYYTGGASSQSSWSVSVRSEGSATSINLKSEKPMALAKLPQEWLGKGIQVTAKNAPALYVKLVRTYIPASGSEQTLNNGLTLERQCKQSDGTMLNLNSVSQGTDFKCYVKVTNTSKREVTNIALTHIVPAGWEIENSRMQSMTDESLADAQKDKKTKRGYADFDFMDLRDDRMMTYFTLRAGEKKEFPMSLHAAYAGDYYYPAIQARAMYQGDVYGVLKGVKTKVIAGSAK